MRVAYSLSFERYNKLQPPFEAIAPVGRGLFFFLYFVTIVVGVGVAMLSGQLYSLLRHSPAPSPGWFGSAEIFGFGVILLTGVWASRKLSARQANKEHHDFLRESYTRLHCQDRRFVETTEEGIVFGCDCKTSADRWLDVLSWGGSRATSWCGVAGILSTFRRKPSIRKAKRTQFRRTLSECVGASRVELSRSVEFCATRRDWQHAKWLLFREAVGFDPACSCCARSEGRSSFCWHCHFSARATASPRLI